MRKPILTEKTENGFHVAWQLIDADTNQILWTGSENKPTDSEKTKIDKCTCKVPKTSKVGNFCYGCSKFVE